jgi:hypothetical protein
MMTKLLVLRRIRIIAAMTQKFSLRAANKMIQLLRTTAKICGNESIHSRRTAILIASLSSCAILLIFALAQGCNPTPTPGPPTALPSTAIPPTATFVPTSAPIVTQVVTPIIPLGRAFKKNSAPAIYLFDRGQKRAVLDINAFGITLDQVTVLPDAQVDAFPTGAPINKVVKGGGTFVYLMEIGKKRHIPDLATLATLGFTTNDISELSDDLINLFPDGEDVPK